MLTQLSLWWFDRLADLVPNHVVSTDVPAEVAGRAVLVPPARDAPGRVHRPRLPHRRRAARSTRRRARSPASPCPAGLVDGVAAARAGLHPDDQGAGRRARPADDRRRGRASWSAPTSAELADGLTRRILARGNEIAAERGILIADTKVEFGVDADGTPRLVLADEVLTPDSSRFWPADEWEPGPPAAVLRQAVRPRLADLAGQRLGPEGPASRRRRCPTTSSSGPGRSTSTPTSG